MSIRRVWKINAAGNLNRLRLAEENIQPLKPGEAFVQVRAVGLNFADIFACLGLYSATPKGEFTPGLEFAGVVEKTNSGDFRPGDRVMGVIRFGAYASHINSDVRFLRPLPRDWSFAEGAAFLAQSLTAWYALKELGNIKQDQVVLVHSAAGGVGLPALAMIDRLKAQAVATVGRPEKVKFLQEHIKLAPERIILRNRRDFAGQLDRALEKMGARGFDLILDSLAGPFYKPGYDRLNPAGRLVMFGAGDMMPAGARPNYLKLAFQYLRRPRPDLLNMISENKSVMAFNLIWLWDRTRELLQLVTEIERLGLAPPFIGHSYPFEEAPVAMRFFQSGANVGKVVLEVD